MLAGHKLLLADDSITIQKVVDLTFADEGVEVTSVSNGREAIERLEEVVPDVVLADVFMPQMNGYEVCEYIKQNDRFRHIPVMLLVGSFEPFDEAEARRVGADDTLTKPFQSIRRLIDKVGVLITGRTDEEKTPTAELPKPIIETPEPEKLSTEELEITTADTQPLPDNLRSTAEETRKAQLAQTNRGTMMDQEKMDTPVSESQSERPERYEGSGDVLLDLGDYRPAAAAADDFVLDIDLDEAPEPSPVEAWSSGASSFAWRMSQVSRGDWQAPTTAVADRKEADGASEITESPSAPALSTTVDQMATTQEVPPVILPSDQPPEVSVSQKSWLQPQIREITEEQRAAVSTGRVTPDQLSPEVIDVIARRAVEQLSENVVREIAWEVVPQLSELLIKQQLEKKEP